MILFYALILVLCLETVFSEIRIIGGVTASHKEFTMVAEIYSISGIYHLCGGSIITRRHVLTAAHCLEDMRTKDIGISVGSIYSIILETKYFDLHVVTKKHMHYGYTSDRLSFDIGILQVSGYFKLGDTIGIVCLAKTVFPKVNQKLMILGWGQTTDLDDRTPPRLMKVLIEIKQQKLCYDFFIGETSAMPAIICNYNVRKGTCLGDSGGPVLYLHKRKYILVGVVNGGGPSCERSPTFNAKVSFYVPWIEKVLHRLDPNEKICIV